MNLDRGWFQRQAARVKEDVKSLPDWLRQPRIVDQPPPVKNDRPSIQDLVIQDIETRKVLGLERYGTLLQPFNGRDALVDAYQEALDLCQYLRQAIEERDA